jgi:tRNA (guanine37-N1)-methyltransferase
MGFHVITLFPELFSAVTDVGVTGRAHSKGLWSCVCHNPRDYVHNVHHTVDDRPYGGGPGMVMMYQPLADTFAAVTAQCADVKPHFIYLSPQGKPLTQARAAQLVQLPQVALLCGRYEGVDERFITSFIDEEISVGDFVVSGGELPAMMLIDAVVRLLPGVLGHAQSAVEDSFAQGLLDCPHYTRPPVIAEQEVPAVLQSGDHAKIAKWRRQQQLIRTAQRRPELLANVTLTKQEQRWLREVEFSVVEEIEKINFVG